MPLHNVQLSEVFQEIADLLEVEDENPFRIRAYRNAARTLGEYGQELAELVEQGRPLPKLPGIGEDLQAKIVEIAHTGTCPLLTRLRGEVSPALTYLLAIPGLGPKRVRTLYHELAISSPADLQRAAEQGLVRNLPGFGPKLEKEILQALSRHLDRNARQARAGVRPSVDSLLDYLRRVPGARRVEVAGSYRRRRDTVGDIDILVVAAPGYEVPFAFTAYEDVDEVLAQGTTKASVRLRSGLQVDLRVVPEESFGAALLYFTGSKAHNIVLRQMAQSRGLKINEYGVYRNDERIAGETEASVYATLQLPFIAPELREARGEIEAARDDQLPILLTRQDLRGDLHVHTKAGDGQNSIEEMARAARALGLDYLAITDHSRSLHTAKGLDEDRLLAQLDEIDRLQADGSLGVTLLKGVEVDIQEDGQLDLPASLLDRLDIVVAAVHEHFALPPARQTTRLLRALDQRVHVLAHPTGRLIGQRPPLEFDFAKVLRHARECGCALELDAQPLRLDLDDLHCREAREAGVLICVDSDAYSATELHYLDYGVDQARRGWLERRDVLNTRSLAELKAFLRHR
ncbi:DNA polymerase/3'-5' exonuclease PolX [Pseudogulbenkiania sp. MAI-1]|uniref:DNA polymerase/3'-5' exonuclease PolX n=1 Tax=Pseudogulbenkiania sp. MAI-1 TaxID=990370 RepID=UPI00045EA86F|nr:DNA polymerase/3'-5' exonuclease PolX [Pseudogulbenkiania sp. MAI-1]